MIKKILHHLLKAVLGIPVGLIAVLVTMTFWAFIRSHMENPIYVMVMAGTPLLNIVLMIANAAILVIFLAFFLIFRKLKVDSSLFRIISCIVMAFLALSGAMFIALSAKQAFLWHMLGTAACLLFDLAVLAFYFRSFKQKVLLVSASVSSILTFIVLGMLR